MSVPHDQEYEVIKTQTATVSTVAVLLTGVGFGFTANELATATRAVMSCHSADAHYRYDGGVPTSTVGHHINEGNRPQVVYGHGNINALQFIREGSQDTSVTITLETSQGGV
tara:strand:- start:515 stop:850 length:336 start_codon:yes stop_codon:yes gene_type:complete